MAKINQKKFDESLQEYDACISEIASLTKQIKILIPNSQQDNKIKKTLDDKLTYLNDYYNQLKNGKTQSSEMIPDLYKQKCKALGEYLRSCVRYLCDDAYMENAKTWWYIKWSNVMDFSNSYSNCSQLEDLQRSDFYISFQNFYNELIDHTFESTISKIKKRATSIPRNSHRDHEQLRNELVLEITGNHPKLMKFLAILNEYVLDYCENKIESFFVNNSNEKIKLKIRFKEVVVGAVDISFASENLASKPSTQLEEGDLKKQFEYLLAAAVVLFLKTPRMKVRQRKEYINAYKDELRKLCVYWMDGEMKYKNFYRYLCDGTVKEKSFKYTSKLQTFKVSFRKKVFNIRDRISRETRKTSEFETAATSSQRNDRSDTTSVMSIDVAGGDFSITRILDAKYEKVGEYSENPQNLPDIQEELKQDIDEFLFCLKYSIFQSLIPLYIQLIRDQIEKFAEFQQKNCLLESIFTVNFRNIAQQLLKRIDTSPFQ